MGDKNKGGSSSLYHCRNLRLERKKKENMHVVHLGGRTKEKENKICGFEVSAIWKQQFKVKFKLFC